MLLTAARVKFSAFICGAAAGAASAALEITFQRPFYVRSEIDFVAMRHPFCFISLTLCSVLLQSRCLRLYWRRKNELPLCVHGVVSLFGLIVCARAGLTASYQ
jgi:hypothetical protein